MNKKNNNFDSDDSKYKALEKNENQKDTIKAPKEADYKLDSVSSGSEYEIYESLDKLNSFTVKNENKIASFFSRIFNLEKILNIFEKFLTKFLFLSLDENSIFYKFLKKFSSKLQKVLFKMLLLMKMRMLMMNFVFNIIRYKIQLKLMELIFKKTHENQKEYHISQGSINKETEETRKSYVLKSFDFDIDIKKKDSMFLNSNFNFSSMSSVNQKIFDSGILGLQKNLQDFELKRIDTINYDLKKNFEKDFERADKNYFFLSNRPTEFFMSGRQNENNEQGKNKFLENFIKIAIHVASAAISHGVSTLIKYDEILTAPQKPIMNHISADKPANNFIFDKAEEVGKNLDVNLNK